jgi:hypothetical protein
MFFNSLLFFNSFLFFKYRTAATISLIFEDNWPKRDQPRGDQPQWRSAPSQRE